MANRTQDATKRAAGRNGSAAHLPRLGDGTAAPDVTVVVDLPDLGASVVVKKPSVGAMIDVQAATDTDDDDPRAGLVQSARLVASVLVEPDWDAERVAREAENWTFSDWMHLQEEVGKLIDLQEVGSAARAEFQGSGDGP